MAFVDGFQRSIASSASRVAVVVDTACCVDAMAMSFF
jgi:hypothetical protein